jgi:N6-L-threonylcarbamoyladenine synthase
MSLRKLYLGIDTSCYTTSVAAACEEKIISLKKPLEVKVGTCGLRQSEAFFQHSKNLPVLIGQLKEQINFKSFDDIIVTASSRPRNIDGSYMPVFSAGQGYAKAIAAATDAKYIETSHQEGHIMAALHSCQKHSIIEKPFLTYHISGGTTELLLSKKVEDGFKCEIIGGTIDLPAGQFIDRIGVKAGFPFPCGKYIDEEACGYTGEKPRVKTCVKDEYINLSGEETRYNRILDGDATKGYVSYCTMKCISDSLKKSIISAQERYNTENVLMVGGVSSSQFLRNEFSDMKNVFFAERELCTDNAVGTCLMGKFKLGELF